MGRFFGRGEQQPQETAGQFEGPLRAVEGILAAIGVDANAARMEVESGFGWHFQRGSALIEVYLTPEQDGYLQVLSPIMHLPQRDLLALYRRLLELELTNAALGVRRCGLRLPRAAAGGPGRGRRCHHPAAGAVC